MSFKGLESVDTPPGTELKKMIDPTENYQLIEQRNWITLYVCVNMYICICVCIYKCVHICKYVYIMYACLYFLYEIQGVH